MKALLHNTFQVEPGEQIQVATVVDNPPLLVGFQTPPHGGKWAAIKKTRTTDTRTFTCPSIAGHTFSFFVSCAEDIPAGAPYAIADYTFTFSSISNPAAPPVESGINVPRGLGPISLSYTFIVTL